MMLAGDHRQPLARIQAQAISCFKNNISKFYQLRFQTMVFLLHESHYRFCSPILMFVLCTVSYINTIVAQRKSCGRRCCEFGLIQALRTFAGDFIGLQK